MWSLLFYYALLNAGCIAVLLAISWDPPVWEEDELDLWPTPAPATTQLQEQAAQQAPTPPASPILYDIDAKAVA